MRFRDWYFQGWERRTGADGKTALVYTGETYSFPAGLPAARRRVLPLLGAVLAAYLGAAIFPSPGGMWHIAAIPQLLELIPLMYLLLGGARLALAKEPMTYRDWYASLCRVQTSAAWSLGLAAAMAAAELAYLVTAAEPLQPGAELRYSLCVLACGGLSFWLFRYLKQHPCRRNAPAEKE